MGAEKRLASFLLLLCESVVGLLAIAADLHNKRNKIKREQEMNKFKWNWPRPLKVSTNIAAVIVLLVVIVGLNFLVQRSNHTKRSSESQTDRLNVALVNEDQAVTDHKKNYNLGADYVKTIERDNSQNWTVTTRSTAESGLKSGRYQLAVFIPTDFSSKVLDINNVLVDKTTVTYKINAKGNTKVESDAKQVGDKVVSDLNSQLVNMYLASVLGNLYTAQQNAKAVSNIQTRNIGDYQRNLLQSAVNFEDVFPSLVSMSNGSLEANNSLAKALQESASQADKENVDGSKINKDLSSLLTDYSDGKANNADIVENAMSSDPGSFSKQLDTIAKRLEGDQNSVSRLLKKTEDNGSGANLPAVNDSFGDQQGTSKKPYEEVLQDATKQLNTLEEKLKSAKEKNSSSGQEKTVEEIVKEEVEKYYGKSLYGVTVNDLLTHQDTTSTGGSNISNAIDSYKNSINTLVFQSVNSLPADKFSDLPDLTGVTETNYAAEIKQYSNEKSAAQYGYSSQDSLGLRQQLEDAAKNVRNSQTEVGPTSSLTSVVQAKLASPEGVDSWSVKDEDGQTKTADANQPLEIDLSKLNTFTYKLKEDSSASGKTISVEVGKATIASISSDSVKEYGKSVEQYSRIAQQIVDSYNNAGSLLNAYYPEVGQANIADNLLNQSVKELLVDLLTKSIEDSLKTYSSDVDVNGALSQLKDTRATLESDLKTIIETNDKVESDIGDTLKDLKALQKNGAGESNSKEKEADAKARSDKSSELSSNISKLVSQSESLKASAKSNAKSAESVSKSFSSFNDAAKKAQSDGQKLSGDAKKLMTQFNSEMSDTNDFVKSFKDVLDNAYNNGVPNEALLEFLSSPVASRSTSYKSRINTYRPFTWILLLAVINLFTAYLFATQDLIGRVKNKFAKGIFSDTDPLNVGTLTALALIEGVALGVASARSMSLDRDMIPSWILLFVLFSLALLHGQYFLIKHMKSLGMALGLYNLVSFVYFSNAVGTTVGLTGFVQKLKIWNPLSLMEKTLSAYFDNITADGGLILGLISAVVIMIALNTIIRFPWEKQRVNEEKVA